MQNIWNWSGMHYLRTYISVELDESIGPALGWSESDYYTPYVRADIGQRAVEQAGERREHAELIEQKYAESQERHGKLLANPAYPDGRIW